MMLTMQIRAYREDGTEIGELDREVHDIFECTCLLSVWQNKISTGQLEIPAKVKRIDVKLSEDINGNPHDPAILIFQKYFV